MKRILFVNEASFLSSGYATYGREIISRLNDDPDYEVAELACYIDGNDPNIQNYKWKVYPNIPLGKDKERYNPHC